MFPIKFFQTALLLFAALLFFCPGDQPGFPGSAVPCSNTYSSPHVREKLLAAQILLEECDRDAPESREEDVPKPAAYLPAFDSPGLDNSHLRRALSNLPPGGKQDEPLSHFSRPPPFLLL